MISKQNFMLSPLIAQVATPFTTSAPNTTYPKLPWCVGTRSLTEPSIPLRKKAVDHILPIQIAIPFLKSVQSKDWLNEIPASDWQNCIPNWDRFMVIQGIIAAYIAFWWGWVITPNPNPRENAGSKNTTLQKNSEKKSKSTSSTFLRNATPTPETIYRYYQYTAIDEASRERFICFYREISSYSSVDFLRRTIRHFGYVPRVVQTDNGLEFSHFKETKIIHPFDRECERLGIVHKTIKPRTPRHNGKVERSHRTDNERFYSTLRFYSFEDLQKQGRRYLYRSNRIGMTPLNYKTPIEKRLELMESGLVNWLRTVWFFPLSQDTKGDTFPL